MQGYRGAAVGKGRQLSKTELEKLKFSELSMREAVMEAARMYVHPFSRSRGNIFIFGVCSIFLVHDDAKEKDFELEMTWISSLDGPTKGRHEEVPKELREEAERLAKKALEGEDEDEDDEKMEE